MIVVVLAAHALARRQAESGAERPADCGEQRLRTVSYSSLSTIVRFAVGSHKPCPAWDVVGCVHARRAGDSELACPAPQTTAHKLTTIRGLLKMHQPSCYPRC